jgi:hypothetical protein
MRCTARPGSTHARIDALTQGHDLFAFNEIASDPPILLGEAGGRVTSKESR